MKKMIVGGLAVLAVAGFAGTAAAVTDGDPYVAPSYGSEKNVAGEHSGETGFVLADVPQEKFVSPDGVLRAGVTPNGDEAMTVAAYSSELDGVCTRVGAALDGDSEERVALALDEAVSDVEALATPSDLAEFEQQLVDLAERQAQLIRQLGNEDVAALGAELEQVGSDTDALFAQQGGFEVCGQA
jgi:hypothetical protein